VRVKLPSHLSANKAVGLVTDEPVAQFELGTMRNFVYLVLDWTEHQAAIVDPQSDLETPLTALKQNGFTLSKVLLTHTHFDHVAGVPEIVERFPHVPVIVHDLDLHRLDEGLRRGTIIQPASEGDTIAVGALSLSVLHTPGHTAGGCCYLLNYDPPYLLTGDTLFIRDCGRTDLSTGSNADLFTSLNKIRKLPANTVILPGHHYQRECASTLARELKESPPFSCHSVEDLKALP
jgi:hydroxyacylglutathione hydrolase